jgi:hypothetical protein
MGDAWYDSGWLKLAFAVVTIGVPLALKLLDRRWPP